MLTRTLALLGSLAVCSFTTLPSPASANPAPAEAVVAAPAAVPVDAEMVNGEAAVARLDRLTAGRAPAVGAGFDPRRELLADRQLWVDRAGNLLYRDAMLDKPEAGSLAAAPSTASAVVPYSQTFLLHSRPGSNRVIYLDFNGETIAGTAWNNSSTGASFYASPYDSDGVPSVFSPAEHDAIQGIWLAVAEDYAPFDIDVTTQAPDPAAITRSSSSDTVYGTRALISNTTAVYNSCGCGGVAYVGTFDTTSSHAYYQPAWVFTQGVGTSVKTVAEAASHEVGHNLGLRHDGSATSGYYAGHANWAPIMGVGYYRPITQFSAGEYGGATNPENDFDVIAANGGVPIADDAGDTTSGAVALGASPASSSGVIGTRADRDLFRIVTGATTLSVAAVPAAAANADLRVDLLDAAGNLVAAADPATGATADQVANGMAAGLVAAVPAGTYYVRIDGVGFGDPTSTGYSDYGSVGRYTVTVNGQVPPPNHPPVAALTANVTNGTAPLSVAFSSSGSHDPDGTIAAYWWTFGDGTTSSAANPTKVYTAAGTYTATLTVADNSGATASVSRQITVTAGNASTVVHVGSITMEWVTTSSGRLAAKATITVLDGNGNPVKDVLVSGNWTGTKTGTASGLTSLSGVRAFTSPSTSASAATYTFTVTSLTRSGYRYEPSANKVTSATIRS